MPLPIASDIAAILNLDEFALTATYRRANALGDSVISGILDNETIPVDTGGFVSVHEEQPRFTCRTSDLPYISEDDEIIIGSSLFNIRAWVHDGTGVTVLQLERK